MAVGDVVNGISSANTVLDFQPAAGVECMISAVTMNGTNVYPSLYDGVNTSGFGWSVSQSDNILNIKLFITNSLYLRLPAAGAGEITGYTGIQIK